MSMQTSITYGYGVDINVICVELKAFLRFYEKHLPEDYKKMLEKAESEGFDIENLNEENEEFSDWLDGYVEAEDEYDISGCGSFYSVIAYIMRKETGVFIDEVRSEYDWAIMHPETHPWYMNETEKNLTEEKLCEIFKKYFAELDVDVVPNYVRVESFG